MKKLLISLLFVAPLQSWGISTSPHWGVGYYSQYMSELSADSTSQKSSLGKSMIPLSYKSTMNVFGASYVWGASLAGLFPSVKTNDGAANNYLIQLSMSELFWNEGSSSWFYGGGLSYSIIKGNGGTITLNNGSGTQVFQLPGGSSSSKVFFLELGYMYDLPSLRVDTSLQMDNFLGNSRSISLAVNLMFPWGL